MGTVGGANRTIQPERKPCQRSIRVRGIVQGVGFRPAVWRYARKLGLRGYVLNDGEGVKIECVGTQQQINQLIRLLRERPPAQARITEIVSSTSSANISSRTFEIAQSHVGMGSHTGISPDLVTCPECLTDILEPDNRRHRYAFTNCTHCGPRLSIVQQLPYDRANTSMAEFTQCDHCRREYQDPGDRRFHAQPNACPLCGPQLWLSDQQGRKLVCHDVIEDTVQALRTGKILALKGLGGFQLAVDASNGEALSRLRLRKQRPVKPFALMARDLSTIRKYCHVSHVEQALLESAAAPIVVLSLQQEVKQQLQQPELRPDQSNALGLALAQVAPGQNRLGFMLPTSPLHHLLLAAFDTPLVMTSGNPAGEPQCIDNVKALQHLSILADRLLMHDRDIVQRVDDSVVQVIDEKVQPLRRARGYAPTPLPLPDGFQGCAQVLAMGAELKNTFCLLKDGTAVLSQHIGDLQDAVTLADYEHNLELFKNLYEHQPTLVAIDEHPQYLATQQGVRIAQQQDVGLVQVQHHHAHIAACLGDNGRPLSAPLVLGVALDGLGFAYGREQGVTGKLNYGGTSGYSLEEDQLRDSSQGEIWGGEILLADYRQASRVARLKPVPLPGANIAMVQPWRNCLAQLHRALGWSHVVRQYSGLPLVECISAQPADTLVKMMDSGFNSPLSSSCGRLFDAVAMALGFCPQHSISFEGEAPMAMEAVIDGTAWQQAKVWPMAQLDLEGLIELDPAPLWRALMDDLQSNVCAAVMAASFYKSLVSAFAQLVQQLARRYQVTTVALSGGCFQSPTLQSALQTQLRNAGLDVLSHHQVPANDGGLCFGQALVAAARTTN